MPSVVEVRPYDDTRDCDDVALFEDGKQTIPFLSHLVQIPLVLIFRQVITKLAKNWKCRSKLVWRRQLANLVVTHTTDCEC
jgi:hypothetical protein